MSWNTKMIYRIFGIIVIYLKNKVIGSKSLKLNSIIALNFRKLSQWILNYYHCYNIFCLQYYTKNLFWKLLIENPFKLSKQISHELLFFLKVGVFQETDPLMMPGSLFPGYKFDILKVKQVLDSHFLQKPFFIQLTLNYHFRATWTV